MNVMDIYVRSSTGGYVTNSVNGMRSSSTHSQLSAANRQAEKVFGPSLQKVECIETTSACAVFRVTADADKFAFCWATGLIEFGDAVPADACEVARGPDRALRQLVEVVARHAKPRSTGQLLVPGVPEAPNQDDGMTALLKWLRWCCQHHPKGDRGSFGVEFYMPREEA